MAYPRILIIEDIRQTVDDLRDYFEVEGYEAEVALNSQVALSIIAERKMSLALVGMEVHDVPAAEIIKELRSIDPSLPIVVIYENKSKRAEAALAKAGALDFISKPLNRKEVLQKVRNILEPKETKQVPKRKSMLSKPKAVSIRLKKKVAAKKTITTKAKTKKTKKAK